MKLFGAKDAFNTHVLVNAKAMFGTFDVQKEEGGVTTTCVC